MLHVLVPIDDSAYSLRAINHLIALKDALRPVMQVLLINVQPGAPTLNMMLDGRPSEVRRLEEPLKVKGMQTLGAAERALDAAGVEHRSFVECGDPAQLIVDCAKHYHCDMIVIGMHGMDTILSAVPGSVVTKVLHLTSVPVVVVP